MLRDCVRFGEGADVPVQRKEFEGRTRRALTFERTDWETASEAGITLLAAVFRRPEALKTSEHICRILESGRHEVTQTTFSRARAGEIKMQWFEFLNDCGRSALMERRCRRARGEVYIPALQELQNSHVPTHLLAPSTVFEGCRMHSQVCMGIGAENKVIKNAHDMVEKRTTFGA